MTLPLKPPAFASTPEYASYRYDVEYWRPYVVEILARHGLLDAGQDIVSGVGGTYPTFLYGNVVVKLFGFVRTWSESYAAERAALTLVATDPGITAPNLLFEGRLYEGVEASWPYQVTTRMTGVAWAYAELSAEQRLSVVEELGRLLRRVHALQPSGAVMYADWRGLDLTAAAKQSSLPNHLIAQIDDYVSEVRPPDKVFVHGDITGRHIFVENGQLSGVIDWGDAVVADRHYEICQLHRDLFNCDKALLRVFLEASDWPVGKDFPHLALGYALYRQAMGLATHLGMDVFEPVAELLPLDDIGTLEELAIELYAI